MVKTGYFPYNLIYFKENSFKSCFNSLHRGKIRLIVGALVYMRRCKLAISRMFRLSLTKNLSDMDSASVINYTHYKIAKD